MKLMIQRVAEAHVRVDGEVIGKIGKGALVLLGIHKEDTPETTEWFVQKLLNLRFFEDSLGNLSLKDVEGEVLIVSQFTLYGNCQNGRRPDFFEAAPGHLAEPIYEKFIAEVFRELGHVQQGKFGAMMQVSLVNDGPVTLIVDKNR
jgi:D-tyrosyl-tRNA(Tyr) deacylase